MDFQRFRALQESQDADICGFHALLVGKRLVSCARGHSCAFQTLGAMKKQSHDFFAELKNLKKVFFWQKHLLFEFFSVGFLEAWPLRGGMVAVEGNGPA